ASARSASPRRSRRCTTFFFSSRSRHTRLQGGWSSDVCSSDLARPARSSSGPGACSALGLGLDRVVKTLDYLTPAALANYKLTGRSEERRVGKESRSR